MSTTSQTYLDLVGRFPLDPIRDDAHLDQAIAFLDPLLPPFDDEGVRAYVLALGGMIQTYESATIPLGEATPGEVLAVLMDGRGVGPVELADEIGLGMADVVAILDGVRLPMREEAVSFAKCFGLSPSAFVS